MLIVLLQRGRGGGLAGAFGGLGGQSAFGTKAGDVFTKVTIGIALFWVVMAGVTGFAMRRDAEGQFAGGSDVAPEQPTMTAGESDEEATDEPPFGDELAAEEEGSTDAEAEAPAEEPAAEDAGEGGASTPAESDDGEGENQSE